MTKAKSKAKTKSKGKGKPAKKERFSELKYLRELVWRARTQMEKSDPANALMIFGPPATDQEKARFESPYAQPGAGHNVEQTRDLEGESKGEQE